jgi:oxygen-dependent protoporphyrinogen oxidase
VPVPREAPRPLTVAVVGGGITGLVAAWELTGGDDGPGPDTPSVVVLEATDRLGGKLRTVEFDGRPVDQGPDGFLGRRAEAVALCRAIGLGDDLMPIAASGAEVWARGRRRVLPSGLAMGIPTRFLPTARSGILGPLGTLRLFRDLAAPRRDVRGPLGDRAIGPLVARKLGHRVVDRLVDPLIGGIHAGGVADMSTAAVFPLLLAVAQRRTGFMRSLRQATATAARMEAERRTEAGEEEDPAAGPAFWSLRNGMGSLVDRLAEVLDERGVTVRTNSPVELLDEHGGPGSPWVLHTAEGPVVADGVVLAVPAGPAAELLTSHDGNAAALLRGIDHASVAIVTFEYPEEQVPAGLIGTGLLVPRGTVLPPSGRVSDGGDGGASDRGSGHGGGSDADRTCLVTACSYLSTKWPHLSRPGQFLVRASVGRFGDARPAALDDDALIARVRAELGVLLGIHGEPTAATVQRWHDALPQYRVHHLLRVTGIESAVAELPSLAVAGAAYRGVGIAACVASGRSAGRAVLDSVRQRRGDGGRDGGAGRREEPAP